MDRLRRLPPAAPPPELQQGVSVRDLLAVLRRRRWHFLIPTLLVTAGFVAAAYLLPPRYRAQALLAVEPSATAVEGTPAAQDEFAGQLERATEGVKRRSLLEPVIRHFELYPGREGAGVAERELEAMRSRITVQARGPSTFSLAFEDRDPERAARVAERLAERLIENAGAERQERAGSTAEFVGGRLESLRRRIAEREAEIEAYKQRHAGELPEKDTSLLALLDNSQQRVQDNAATIAQLEARRSAVERELSELERHIVTPDPGAERVAELERTLSELQMRYTDRHPEVIRARRELEDAESAAANGAAPAMPTEPSTVRLRQLELVAERQELEGRLDSAYAERGSLHGQAAGYRQRVAAAPRHEVALAAMNRELAVAEEQYQELAEELDGARRAEHLAEARQGGYQIVESPRVPTEPFAPHRLRIALMGLVVGLGLGAVAGFFTEQLDTSVRDVEDVESPTNLPVLAAIPSMARSAVRRLHSGSSLPAMPALAPLDDPHGAAGEQYRILATKLISASGAPRPTTLLVTSAVAGEGKTTTAVNLALALARMMKDEAVLLVDADFARPAVHRLLHLPLGNGLARLLENPDEDPSRFTRYHHGLYLLEAGESKPRTRSALASPLAQRVFQRLRQRFAYIVVDAPPVLTVAEGLILQRMVDSILLVVRAGKTPRELVRRAVESVDLSRLAGILLNDVDVRGPGYGYGYYGSPYRAYGGGRPPIVDVVPAGGRGA